MLYRLAFKLKYLYASRMNEMLEFLADRLEAYDDTAHLDTARRGARTSSYEHRDKKRYPRKSRPQVKVRRRKSGRRHHGRNIEKAVSGY